MTNQLPPITIGKPNRIKNRPSANTAQPLKSGGLFMFKHHRMHTYHGIWSYHFLALIVKWLHANSPVDTASEIIA